MTVADLDVDVFITEDGVHILAGDKVRLYRNVVAPTGGVTKEKMDGDLLIEWSTLLYHAAVILEALEVYVANQASQEPEEPKPTLEVVTREP